MYVLALACSSREQPRPHISFYVSYFFKRTQISTGEFNRASVSDAAAAPGSEDEEGDAVVSILVFIHGGSTCSQKVHPSLALLSLRLSMLQREVPGVEAGPRQSAEHLCPVGGAGHQQGLHAGCDVVEVSTAHLRTHAREGRVEAS